MPVWSALCCFTCWFLALVFGLAERRRLEMTRRRKWCWPAVRLDCLSEYLRWLVCCIVYNKFVLVIYIIFPLHYSYMGWRRIHKRNSWGDLHKRTSLVSGAIRIRFKSRIWWVIIFVTNWKPMCNIYKYL